jgi:hypothetical protein
MDVSSVKKAGAETILMPLSEDLVCGKRRVYKYSQRKKVI